MQKMKRTEARIIMYLNSVDEVNKFIGKIASKLSIEFSYCVKILNEMKDKGWIKGTKIHRKTFIALTKKADIGVAKSTLINTK